MSPSRWSDTRSTKHSWVRSICPRAEATSVIPATIARMSRCCADRLQSFIDTVREEVCRAKVKHLDETGFRLAT